MTARHFGHTHHDGADLGFIECDAVGQDMRRFPRHLPAGPRDEDRNLTDRLYGGDRRTRIRQEILMGIGGIRALEAGRISVVPGWANKAIVMFVWATPRWLHQAVFSRIMNG